MTWLGKIIASGVVRWIVGTTVQTGIIVTFVYSFMSISLVSMDSRMGDIVAATARIDEKIDDGFALVNQNLSENSATLASYTERFNSVDKEFNSVRREFLTGFDALRESITRLEPTAGEPMSDWSRTYLASFENAAPDNDSVNTPVSTNSGIIIVPRNASELVGLDLEVVDNHFGEDFTAFELGVILPELVDAGDGTFAIEGHSSGSLNNTCDQITLPDGTTTITCTFVAKPVTQRQVIGRAADFSGSAAYGADSGAPVILTNNGEIRRLERTGDSGTVAVVDSDSATMSVIDFATGRGCTATSAKDGVNIDCSSEF